MCNTITSGGPSVQKIEDDALYKVEEVAAILRFEGTEKSRTNAVYRIPEDELPRTRIGGGRGSTRWVGRNIRKYIEARTGKAA